MEKLSACKIKYIEKTISSLQNKFWKDVLQSVININEAIDIQEEQVLKKSIILL